MKLIGRTCYLALTMGLLSSSVYAGSFTAPNNTSGVTFTGNPGSGTPTFAKGSVTGTCGGGNGSVSISGSASTTYEWQSSGPGDSAPENVVVIESCTVTTIARSFFGTGFVAPTGTSNNGMTGTWSNNAPIASSIIYAYGPGFSVPIGIQQTSSSIGTRARIIVGTGDVVVSSTVSSNASAGNGTDSTFIDYKVVGVYPATVSVAGTITVGGLSKILPGQPAIGGLGVGGDGISVKPGSYQWDITGDTFTDFVVSPDLVHGHVERNTDLNAINPQWRWTLPIQSVVACSATLKYQPIGFASAEIGTVTASKIVEAVTVASTQTITCYQPGQLLFNPKPILTSKPVAHSDATYIQYLALAPTDFNYQGTGDVSIVQTLTDTAYLVDDEPSQAVAGDDVALDVNYPYAHHAANGAFGTAAVDAPAIGGHLDSIKLEIIFSAKDNVMYTPPNGKPVPLKYGKWTHSSKAVKTNGTWNLQSSTTIKISENQDLSIHPEWDFLFVNVGE